VIVANLTAATSFESAVFSTMIQLRLWLWLKIIEYTREFSRTWTMKSRDIPKKQEISGLSVTLCQHVEVGQVASSFALNDIPVFIP
jgi:hypothetical protein